MCVVINHGWLKMFKTKLFAVLLALSILTVFPSVAHAQNIWQQFIQEEASDKGTRATGWYTTTTTCDNEPDTDYVFAFQLDARNPDGLRFRTDYKRVGWALPDQLNAYGLNFFEARVCVGRNTVTAAGGPEAVKAHLLLFNK